MYTELFFILLLLVAGLALVVLELLAIPGTTITGLCGLGLIAYGMYEMFVNFGILWGIVSVVITLLICVLLLIYSLRTRTWKKLSLNKEINAKVNTVKVPVKAGDRGVSITRLAPVGMAEINNERLEVYTSTSYVEPNTPLIVDFVEGNKIRVVVDKEKE